MVQSIAVTVKSLREMSVKQLRAKYEAIFGEPCRSSNKDFLWKRIAWRIQAEREGGLSDRAKKRAVELADESEVRMIPPKNAFAEYDTISGTGGNGKSAQGSNGRDHRLPPPGTAITHEYKGGLIEVTVLEKGFEFEGVRYRSLSAIANVVTGSHINGFSFFGLNSDKETIVEGS